MNKPPVDESLDPADWEALRRLAHQAVDDGFDYLMTYFIAPKESAGCTGPAHFAGTEALA